MSSVKSSRLRSSVLTLVLSVAASAASAQEAVYVVRHAEKADESADAPLSSAGVARARKLAAMLENAGITHVFTSERRRTAETAAPLATARHLSAQQVAAADLRGLTQKLSALGPHDRALVVGHSNTVPDLLRALHVDTPITIGDAEYDNLFIVVPRDNAAPTLLRLKY